MQIQAFLTKSVKKRTYVIINGGNIKNDMALRNNVCRFGY